MATRTWTNNAAPFLDAVTLAAVELDIAAGGKPLTGPGIDLTGATPSTTAVQAFLNACSNGDTVIVPTGAVINLTNAIEVTKRLRFTGTGELQWTAGIANLPAFHVTADGVTFDGIRMTNPGRLAAATGNRAYGIRFEANYGTVTGCTIDGFQAPIWVDATGEWHHHVVTNNQCLNVPGSGQEDRGDGIYMAGAIFTVTGNIVSCLDGTDGRIGIGAEALQAFVGTPGYAYQDLLGTISGNVVTGPFRRSIANEGVQNVAITGNTMAGFTWWGINIVGTAHYTACVGNTIRFSTNSPSSGITRAGIYVYDNVSGTRIAENSIFAAPGGVSDTGIGVAVGSGGNSVDLLIEQNTIDGGANQIADGIRIANGATRTHIERNLIKGFSANGVTAASVNDPDFNNNRIYGTTGTNGIVTSGASVDGRVDGNTIEGVDNAIRFYFRTGLISVSANNIKSATNGIDLFGWAAPTVVMLALNNFYAVTTHTLNLPSGVNTTVTNIGNN